jgi:hypothetical protein
MIKDENFVLNSVTNENLASLTERQSVLEEQRICEIYELADEGCAYATEMLSSGYGIYEVLSLLSENFLTEAPKQHKYALDENKNRLVSYLKSLSVYDKIVFSEFLERKLGDRGFPVSESDFLPSLEREATFTYVKNSLADEAYDVFSQDFSGPRIKYSASLQEAAKAVSRGECAYALLPLEERGGVRLSSASSLIFYEDLKINSVTPVFGFDGVADMKYALVSSSFSVPTVCQDDDRYLEILLRKDLSFSLSELLVAVDELGASVYRVNTISFRTDDGEAPYYSLVIKDEGKAFTSLLIYLTLFSGTFTPVGIYKNLE